MARLGKGIRVTFTVRVIANWPKRLKVLILTPRIYFIEMSMKITFSVKVMIAPSEGFTLANLVCYVHGDIRNFR